MRTRAHLARSAAALALAIVAALGVAAAANGSAFKRLDGNADAFATDGWRYVMWQYRPGYPLVVYDTRSGHRGEFEDGCDLSSGGSAGGDGRFLVSCATRTDLLDVRTGRLTPLPEVGGWWALVGARYVATDYEAGVRCPAMHKHEGCIFLYEISTGRVSEVPERSVPDLDRGGAPRTCPPVGRKGIEGAIGEGVLAEIFEGHPGGPRNRLLIRRCHGRTTLLHTRTEPKDLEFGGGFLTWDSGNGLETLEEEESTTGLAAGTMTVYRLASDRRQVWRLPRLPIELTGEPQVGAYGSSAHTDTMLLWFADRTAFCGKGGCQTESWSVYGARL